MTHMRLMMMMTLFSEFYCTREQRGQLGSQSQDWSRGSTFPYTQVIQSLSYDSYDDCDGRDTPRKTA